MSVRASLLAAMLFALASAAPGQLTPRQQEVRALVVDMSRAPEVAEWWSRHPEAATKENADVAEELAVMAMEAEQGTAAAAFFTFAALANLHLGDLPASLKSMFGEHQVRYFRAQTPAEYDELRASALSFLEKARSVRANDTAMKFAVLAANCSYFAHLPEGDAIEGTSVAVILSDLLVALEAAKKRSPQADIQDLASLTDAAVQIAMRELYPNYQEIHTLLFDIAAASEEAIPAAFTFELLPQSDARTIELATTLARLSMHHGNPISASARLEHAQARAWALGSLRAYLGITVQQYDVLKRWTDDRARLEYLRGCARAIAAEIRGTYRSRTGRIWSAYEYDRECGEMLYDELMDDESEPDRLFAVAETAKARTLLDYLSVPPTDLRDGRAAEAAQLEPVVLGFEEAKYKDDSLLAAELKLVSQLSSFSEFSEQPQLRGQALAALERLHAVEGAGFSEAASPASVAEIQAALGPDEAILEYVIPYHPLHPARAMAIFAVTRTDVLGVHMDLDSILPRSDNLRMSLDGAAPVDASAIGDQVIGLRVAIQEANERTARTKLRGFYELLIAPLVKHGFDPSKYKRLIVVPHGMLHYVPFVALLDAEEVPLIRKAAITMAPSSAVWLGLRKRGGAVASWVGFANPKLESSDLPSLENSAKEVAQIAGFLTPLEARIETADQATKQRFLAAADGGSILHLATHGEFPDENALDRHGLLLGGPDGTLRASEVRRLDLKDTQLAVLSVCNGGLYRMGPADEPYGLVPAFLIAGASNVMATLWPLDDQFGRQFTVEFYRHLLDKGPAEALRQAVLHFVDEDELIRNWAAFVMVGPGRPFDAKPSQAPAAPATPLR